MGLPIFCDYPSDKAPKKTSDQPRPEPTAHARSSIRRRPSIHRGAFPRPPQQRWTISRNNQGYWSPPPPPPMSPPPALPPAPEPAEATHLNDPTSRRLMQMRMLRERQHQGYLRHQERRQHARMELAYEHGHGRGDVMPRRYMGDDQTGDNRRSLLPTPPLEVSSQRGTDGARSGDRTPNDILAVPSITVQHATGLGDRVRSPSPMEPLIDIFDSILPLPHDAPAAETPTLSGIRTTAEIPGEDISSTVPDHLANPSDDLLLRDPDFECFSDSDTTSVSSAELIRGPRRWPDVSISNGPSTSTTHLADLWDAPPQDHTFLDSRHAREYSSFAPPPPPPGRDSYHSRVAVRRIPSLLREHSEALREDADISDVLGSSASELGYARGRLRDASGRLARGVDRDRRARARWDRDEESERNNTAPGGMGEMELDLDLEQMRGILERLSRRQDIPDEWWMSAGLSRDVVRSGGEAGAV